MLRFWKTSNVNFAFATLRLYSNSKESTPSRIRDLNFGESGKDYYFMSYGFSITTSIRKPIGEHLQWNNTSRLFCNGFDKDHLNFDFSNMVIVKLWKYLQLRFDTRLVYNPLANYDIQFRQEFLIGFVYERSNSGK